MSYSTLARGFRGVEVAGPFGRLGRRGRLRDSSENPPMTTRPRSLRLTNYFAGRRRVPCVTEGAFLVAPPDDLFRFFCFDGTAACPRAILLAVGLWEENVRCGASFSASLGNSYTSSNFLCQPTKCKPTFTAFPSSLRSTLMTLASNQQPVCPQRASTCVGI